MKYCSGCGAQLEQKIPPGDHLARAVCVACGAVHYRNPKVIVGCIPEWRDRILMCKRAIEPRLGRWTFPAGFLEQGETTGQGAAREALEESHAEVEIGALLAVVNVPHVSQIYMVHRAQMKSERCGPTAESSEVRLLREDEIPWDEIAFPTIWHSLKFFYADRAAGVSGFHTLDLSQMPRRPTEREIAGNPV